MDILITGGDGQLAGDLIHSFEQHSALAVGRDQLDITNTHQVEQWLDHRRPDVLVNTAAFHQVDRCESNPEQSFVVNAAAPANLAALCRERDILLVHYSTDYVFDGTAGEPYAEDCPVNPISLYGASKAAGEMAIRASRCRHLIIRTCGLYGITGLRSKRGNFPETMLRLAAEGNRVDVVSDQVLTPSFAEDVAITTASLIRAGATGTVHVTNQGACSWFEFADEIFRQSETKVDLRPVSKDDRPLPARRPAYSVLDHRELRRLGIPEPRPWQEAVAAYLAQRREVVVPP
ncbi:MAG: dTDP-4-dehydrorhamnose reductase [Chloroflexota bacterium]